MSLDIPFLASRVIMGVYSGPYKPTPGDGSYYKIPNGNPNAGYSFKDSEKGYLQDPPITTKIINLTSDSTEEDAVTIKGINPGSLSDTSSPSFSPVTIMGRSQPYQQYSNNSARVVTVNFKLHRDMFMFYTDYIESQVSTANSKEYQAFNKLVEDYTGSTGVTNDDVMYDMANDETNASHQKIRDLFLQTINWFRALNYPRYTLAGVVAPRAAMQIGKFLSITGTPSVKVDYESVFAEGYPVIAGVSITITEAISPSWGQDDIKAQKDLEYVKW